jgi:hypothetical protein
MAKECANEDREPNLDLIAEADGTCRSSRPPTMVLSDGLSHVIATTADLISHQDGRGSGARPDAQAAGAQLVRPSACRYRSRRGAHTHSVRSLQDHPGAQCYPLRGRMGAHQPFQSLALLSRNGSQIGS